VSEESSERLSLTADLPVVVLQGEVDLAAAPALREQIDSILASGQSTIVIDLLDATFLDSTALGVLVGGLEECRDAGGELHLIVVEPRILKVLQITGLADSFPIHSTRPGETASR